MCGNDNEMLLKFNSDGKFRIMHVTDTHFSNDNIDISLRLITEACDREKPDLIALTGDIAMTGEREDILKNTDKLMRVFEERGIAVAVTFGNHDSESGKFSREELLGIYNKYPHSLSRADVSGLTGCGTYNIPVYSSVNGAMKYNIWIFDSGDYEGEGRYANVAEDQVDWYRQRSTELETANGHKINSVAFQHIIVPDVYCALKKHKHKLPGCYPHMYDDGYYYSFDNKNENHGQLVETPCCGYTDHGQFTAMAERGDVSGIFSGHDHANSFEVTYKGIRITNSLSTRFDPEKPSFSIQYGYRMIEIDEKDTSSYTTRVVHWYDMFTFADIKKLADIDKEDYKLIKRLKKLGDRKKLSQGAFFLLVRVLFGIRIKYKY